MLANTSLCAEPSDMMAAAAAAAAVASPDGVRSKVKVPEVVNCPDGDTVTVGGGQTLLKSKIMMLTPGLSITFNDCSLSY